MFTPKSEGGEKLVTWMSGDGGAQRQFDYLIISGKRNNWVNKTEVKGKANINPMYRHMVIRMGKYVTLKNRRQRQNEDI